MKNPTTNRLDRIDYRLKANEAKNSLIKYLMKEEGMTREEALALIEKEGSNPMSVEAVLAAH